MQKNIWSKEKIISIILVFYSSDRKLNSNHIQTEHKLLYAAASRYFGGWKEALEASGLDYSQIRIKKPFRRWNEENILLAIKERKQSGLSINSSSVIREDRGLYSAAKRYLGKKGWGKALRLSGFDPRIDDPRLIWTKERVVSKISELKQIDFPLNVYSMIRSKYCGLVNAGCKHYGNWRKTIEAAGLDYNEIMACRNRYWNKDKILKEIKKLEKEGYRLSSKTVQNLHGDIFSAAVVCFGSWSQAVESAGIDYRFHCKSFSYKAWLRKLKPEQLEKIKKQSLEFSKGGKLNG